MHTLKIKPLSVNEAWKGRRFKTPTHKMWRKWVELSLPKGLEIPEGNLKVNIEFGFSSRGSDIDNGVKPLLDALQNRYSFNDNRIYQLAVSKKIVKKGEEYLSFSIEKSEIG